MKIFIAFGRKKRIKEKICEYLESNGHELIILEECPNRGRTIIEKLENNSDVQKAVIICTGDDTIKPYHAIKRRKCARQNVIFEIGYFIGTIGRENIILVVDNLETLSLLSDLNIGFIIFTEKNTDWKQKLDKELGGL